MLSALSKSVLISEFWSVFLNTEFMISIFWEFKSESSISVIIILTWVAWVISCELLFSEILIHSYNNNNYECIKISCELLFSEILIHS